MRALAFLAVADGGDYTPYPVGKWTGVKCGTVSCNHSDTVCKTVSQGCTTDEDVTVIFVNSRSQSGKSEDAFAVEGTVKTTDWAIYERSSASHKYDIQDLKLTGVCAGLLHLTKKDDQCTAECADGPDRHISSTIVLPGEPSSTVTAAETAKKKLLYALLENEAVQRFLSSINGIYVGDWVDGKRCGHGKQTFDNGNIYEGAWVDNKFSGLGEFTFKSGEHYEGTWVDNKFSGHGTFTGSNGIYVGDWVDGKRCGHGKQTFIYEGA